MKIAVRGWNRDMGKTEIASHFLPTMKLSEDGTVRRDTPILYRGNGGITVAWFQSLKLTGNYRMEVHLSYFDVIKLFRSTFDGVLNSSLIEKEGFTMTPEFVKAVLKTVKLTDLTLGDLAAMNSPSSEEPATAERLVEGSNIKPFPRRV